MARRVTQEKKFSPRRHGADIALLIAAIIVIAFAIWVVLGNDGPVKSNSAATPAATTAPTTPSVAPSPTSTKAKVLTAVFVGDSYTTGAGGDGSKWSTLLAKREGWKEVNLGFRGTGYGKEFHAQDCPPAGCPNYLQVIQQVVARAPDIVVVSGGRNDTTNVNAATDNIPQVFKQLRSKLPNARIIAISPFWGAGSYPSSLGIIGSDVRSAVQSVSGQYLDIGSPLKNDPDLVSSDGVYPTAAGNRALAAAVEAALKL